jgi:pyruvate/2-oxoglutarate dehydrogenase complex dihydrolipoamide acyltransferase (E2) component
MTKKMVEVRLTDLDLPAGAILASVWHVREGNAVVAGDCLLEILAGEVTIDVPAPITGILRKKKVAEDTAIETGQLLGIVESMC